MKIPLDMYAVLDTVGMRSGLASTAKHHSKPVWLTIFASPDPLAGWGRSFWGSRG